MIDSDITVIYYVTDNGYTPPQEAFMKKIIFAIVSLLSIAALSFGLAACNDDSADEEGKTTHKIVFTDGDNYTISGLESEAQAGERVSFQVESDSVFYTVGKITMNGTELTEGTAGYTFVMPDGDAEVKVTMSPVGEYDDPDDHLSWGSTVTGLLSLSDGNTARLPLSFDGISSGNFIISVKDAIFSSDENILPSDAIEFVPTTASQGNSIIGGYLTVDLTNAQPGETYIYVNLDPNNSSLGTLIKKFTVTESSAITTMQVTFTYENNTDYPDEDIFINISDIESGTPAETVWLKEFENGEYTFEYAVGHTYYITVAYATLQQDGIHYENMTTLYLNEWRGAGVVGVTDNTLERDNANPARNILRLTTEGIEVPLTIVENA